MLDSVLSVIGWNPLSKEAIEIIKKTPRCILIFPHTSPIDFFMYAMYTYTDRSLAKRCRAVMNPKYTDKFGWFVKKFGILPSTPRDKKNGGATKRIVEELEKMDEFMFLISPKGGMLADQEWRSGFYWLAKELKCPVLPAGFDFIKKEFVMNEPFSVENLTFEEACKLGKERLADIIPLKPSNSEFPLVKHDSSKASFIDSHRLFVIVMVIILVLLVVIILIIVIIRLLRGTRNSGNRNKFSAG